jgi:PAS domain S-box-containing protein
MWPCRQYGPDEVNAVTVDSKDFPFLDGGGVMGARMRALDWSQTALAAPDGWSPTLRVMVRFLLANRFPLLLWWGPQYVSIFNDAYRPILGAKDSTALGQPVSECWSEIWHVLKPLIDTPFDGGPATWIEDLFLEINRYGFIEETHFTVAYSPVPDEIAPRGIGGVLATVHEITEKVIGERRLAILRELGSHSAEAKTPAEACLIAARILEQHDKDIPFALLYLMDQNGTMARLAGSANIPPGEQASPLVVRLGGKGASRTVWPLAEVVRTESSMTLEDLSARVSKVPTGPWSDPPHTVYVVPIRSNTAHQLAGILVAGISPRSKLDESYRSFLELVATQIATAVANAGAYVEERRRTEALAELDRAKTTFFSNISHEFRTPLTLMLGPLQDALMDEAIAPPMRQRLELAHRNSLRLLKLVNSLLDFSRIEAGRLQASFERTDAAAFTRDLASNFRSAIERAGLRYLVDCSLAEPLYIDREMWEKIVLNLLSNALKFTLSGEISISLQQEHHNAVLEVRDTGVGVPPEEVPRLFERFHRVEGGHGRTQEGSGIGLALVQELVKLHGGTISVESTLGTGTVLRVCLPLGAEHLAPGRIREARASASTGIAAQVFVQEALRWIPEVTSESLARIPALGDSLISRKDPRFANTFGARIVLADDNADMRAYVRDLLATHYEVEVAADGAQALAAVQRERPDLILSDVMMPKLNGFELLAAVRADPSIRNVPVVLLSARAGEDARIGGLDAGADDYLIKPFSARELLARVGALLELEKMRRGAEEASRLRTEQFVTLLNEAPLGVFLIDADFRIRELNPTARAAFGEIPELIGRDFREVIHIIWPNPYADALVKRFRHTLETGEPDANPEHIEQRKDRGITEHYEWRINRIPLPDGRYGVVCYFRDISEHVLARARLQAADRQKDEFLAMLAHELRNPLAPIRNASELLSRSNGANAHTEIVGILQRQVTQMTRLVDDLLDVARITQGKIELRRSPMQLAEIIEHAVETVGGLLKDKQHTVSVVANRTPLWVNVDPARLLQCVSNILTNAAKYTEPRGEIRIESHAENGEAVLIITDNGAGIAPALLPHVFDLFVQSDRTLDRAQGGLGIGLSVTKRLVEMHEGQVRARSAGLGHGATFEIRLPIIANVTLPLSASAAAAIVPRRILVVDDNVDAANSLALLLEIDGHETQAVYTAQQALERVAELKPDVILLDIGLPEMNGYEVARRIRSLKGLERMRLIALTGYGQLDDKQRTRDAGFDDHLIKPVEYSTLQQILG